MRPEPVPLSSDFQMELILPPTTTGISFFVLDNSIILTVFSAACTASTISTSGCNSHNFNLRMSLMHTEVQWNHPPLYRHLFNIFTILFPPNFTNFHLFVYIMTSVLDIFQFICTYHYIFV